MYWTESWSEEEKMVNNIRGVQITWKLNIYAGHFFTKKVGMSFWTLQAFKSLWICHGGSVWRLWKCKNIIKNL